MKAKNTGLDCAMRGLRAEPTIKVVAPKNAMEFVAQLANRETAYYYSDYVRKAGKAYGLRFPAKQVRRAMRKYGLAVVNGRVYGKV